MISIIIPVYNAEKYISRCIESVICQTITEWELILIDDGSEDNSASICDEYTKKDNRIRVIHTKNEGVSSARNKGLDVAKGEWITFIDADDWVEDNHLQCFKLQFCENIDLCINSFVADLKYGVRPFIYQKFSTTNNMHSIDVFFTHLRQHSQFLWNKAFRKEYIEKNNIRFDTTLNLGEDNVFILEYLNYIRGLSSSSTCTYHYDQTDENPLSLGRLKRSEEEMCYQLTMNCKAILKLYNKYNIEVLYNYASDYYYTRIFSRIIIPDIKYCFCIAKLPENPLQYFRLKCRLDCSKISDRLIRTFWISVENDKRNSAWMSLNIFLIKTKFKSTAIKCVGAFRNI